jgi:hypothetical protein
MRAHLGTCDVRLAILFNGTAMKGMQISLRTAESALVRFTESLSRGG